MVSLEQPAYAPLMTNAGYLAKHDYTMTYDLDSKVRGGAIGYKAV